MPTHHSLTGCAILFFVLLTGGCSSDNETAHTPAAPQEPVKVRTFEVAATRIADQVEIMATVQAAKSAVISSRISGNITEIHVSPGSFVQKNDDLVHISAEEISAKVLQARAQLSQAERNLKREQKLLQQKAATREAVKSLEDTLKIAQANYREAKTMLGYTTVAAPFDGRITRKIVDVGGLAVPGKPLLHIENEENIQVFTDVPETLASHVHMGMEMDISIPVASLNVTGTVAEITPIADRQSRTVAIKLDIDNYPALRSGQFARVRLPGTTVQTIVVPPETVHSFGQMERIFLEEQGRARLRLVRTGKHYDSGIEILSGLSDGDTIVYREEGRLHDGQPIVTN
ncbi:MAG: efflux RND transporter periplasmic adaptor subunit [Desulfopila sp.]